ncbi:MAG TPA: hypothetical protein P5514_04930 [Bacteroidales bacterium]|nr:hypothetical protein [Bacteroidales bacterium]HRX96266.1 hypothetical protein [Bacteroidales bacterium]
MPIFVMGQDWTTKDIKTFNQNWGVNVNAGLTSYYGDLSIYDNDFVAKLQHESRLGMSAILTKKLDPTFSFSAQVMFGQLKGQKNNLEMRSAIFEYNLHMRLNFVEMFSPNRYRKVGITGFAGIGNFVFATSLYEYYEGGVNVTNFNARVPEFIYFFGGGVNYMLSNDIDITLELSIKQFENDKVDGVVANSGYDYYSYFSMGFTYKINSIFPGQSKRKARLTQLQERQKPHYRPNM